MEWLVRVLNPGVPAWVAIPCNVLAAVVLVLLVLNPVDNLTLALALLAVTCLALYGTALVLWWRGRTGDDASPHL